MASWPPSLPQSPEIRGQRLQQGSNRASFPPELGAPMSRKRGSAGPQRHELAVSLSAAQYATFQTFYQTTINYGADNFTWVHPVTGAATTCKFDDEPEWEPLGGGFWRMTMVLWILP